MRYSLLALPKRLVHSLAKILAIGLLFLAAPLFAAPLFAETWTDPTTGIQWKYSLWRDSFDDSDKATIEGASNAFGSLTIPSTINSHRVTTIEDGTFADCTSLTSVTIPDSVTTIRDSAFLGCTSLTSVTIPDSVTTIGYDAFKGCTNLRHAYIIFNKARNIAPTAFEDSTTKIVLWTLSEILFWVYVGAGILLVVGAILWIFWPSERPARQ